MSKAAAITIGIVITTFIGLLVFLGITQNVTPVDYSAYDPTAFIPADSNTGEISDHLRGTEEAKVILVEYADFSCPMCAEANALIEQYLEDKNGEVALIFRNYPVSDGHPNSIAAASAAEAAGFIKKPATALADPETQTKIEKGLIDDTYYWEMLDTLFKNRTIWWAVDANIRDQTITDLFRRIAPEADIAEFTEHMGSAKVRQKINFDLGFGKHQGVTGTPSYFLGGEKLPIQNLTEIDSVLKPAIEAKLTQAKD